MKFGRLAVAASEGAILAHAIKRPGLILRKGEIVSAEHVAILEAAGIDSVIAAKLEPGDVDENGAARQLAERLACSGIVLEKAFTGRCNLIADAAGLLIVEAEVIDKINAVDESITVATLLPFAPVAVGEMVATVKIIPFSVPGDALDRALASISPDTLRIAPFRPLRVGVVSTVLPGLKPSVIAKTLRILEQRLMPAGAAIVAETRVKHDFAALVAGIAAVGAGIDLLVIFGASAITDRRDVIPAAIEGAEGRVLHLGMPVDPGNLLLLGDLPVAGGGLIPVIGAPGCARSPKENGFDFVLRRLLAGLPTIGADLRRMGVGGLLTEIATRPQPRNPGAADV